MQEIMLQKKMPFLPFVFILLIVFVTATACQLPIQQQTDTESKPDLEATIMVLQTQMIEASLQKLINITTFFPSN